MLGDEDDRVLAPAVRRAQENGVTIAGPIPGDTVFVRASRGEFDCVIACYHDQGLIPVKLLAFGTAVNVTIGLPIIRTSVDHGTAFDIAGKGVADPGSMIAAVKLAAEMASHLRASRFGGQAAAARLRCGTMSAKKAKAEDEKESSRPIADNRKAFHDYHILETFEAGIALLGTEVKGIREGQANLRDSYARVDNGEVWLFNVHINPYSHRGYVDHDPKRKRRLLLHKYEIRKLIGKTVEKGLTLVPTRMYFKNGKIKVAIALARGKDVRDKRETLRRREVDRETRAAVKERVRR